MKMSFAQYLRLDVRTSSSRRRVIREARKLLAARSRRDRRCRTARHRFLRSALAHHEDAIAMHPDQAVQ